MSAVPGDRPPSRRYRCRLIPRRESLVLPTGGAFEVTAEYGCFAVASRPSSRMSAFFSSFFSFTPEATAAERDHVLKRYSAESKRLNRGDLHQASQKTLLDANLGIEKLRLLFRLAKNMGYLDPRRHEHAGPWVASRSRLDRPNSVMRMKLEREPQQRPFLPTSSNERIYDYSWE